MSIPPAGTQVSEVPLGTPAVPARRRALRDFFAQSAARYLSSALGIFRGLLIPRFLPPGVYGVYKTYQMISELSRIGTFGVLSALFRELPIAVVKQERRREALLMGNAFWVTIWSLVPVLVAIGVGGWQGWIELESVPITGWFLLFVPLLLVDRLRIFFNVVFSGQKRFVFDAKLRTLEEVVSTLLCVGMTWRFGFPGLLIATLLTGTLIVILSWRGSGFSLGAGVDLPLAREMARVGFPHMLQGLGFSVYSQIDRMVVLGALGLVPMGFYAVGMTLTNQLVAASQVVGRILTPRMMERYAERENVDDLRQVFVTPARGAALLYAPAVVLCAVLGEPLFRLLLPRYLPGLLPFQIVVLGAFFAAIWGTVYPFFLAIRRQGRVLAVYAATIPLALGLNLGALHLGLDLAGIALATTLTQFGFVTTVLSMGLSQFGMGPLQRLRELGRIYSPALVIGLAWFLADRLRTRFGLADRPLSGALAEAAVLVLVYGLYAGVLLKLVGAEELLGLEASGE